MGVTPTLTLTVKDTAMPEIDPGRHHLTTECKDAHARAARGRARWRLRQQQTAETIRLGLTGYTAHVWAAKHAQDGPSGSAVETIDLLDQRSW